MRQSDQLQRITAYGNFDPSKLYANCEECGERIPVELTWCDHCNPLQAEADPEYTTRLEAARVTLEFGSKSTKRLDGGREPIEESPLWGGTRQRGLFD